MKFAPKNWNDVLAIILVVGLPLYWRWLLALGLPTEIVMVIIGALIGNFGQVVTYYFRKAPPGAETEGNPDTLPPHG